MIAKSSTEITVSATPTSGKVTTDLPVLLLPANVLPYYNPKPQQVRKILAAAVLLQQGVLSAELVLASAVVQRQPPILVGVWPRAVVVVDDEHCDSLNQYTLSHVALTSLTYNTNYTNTTRHTTPSLSHVPTRAGGRG